MFITKGFVLKTQAIGNHKGKKIIVSLLGGRQYHIENLPDLKKLKQPVKRIGYWLPGRFKAEGLPYELEFTLDIVKPANYPKTGAEFKITELEIKCSNGFSNFDIPDLLLRSLAIKASTHLFLCTPIGFKKNGREYLTQVNPIKQTETPSETLQDFLGQLKGEDLYRRLGEIWRNASHGSIYQDVRSTFGFGDDWANKHIFIGKRKYPQYFKKLKTTKTNRRKTK
jgi:hypothetical protein